MTNDITKERLIEIIKTKAFDCFIHNDLLIVDITKQRMVIKNIKNKQEFVNIFKYKNYNIIDLEDDVSKKIPTRYTNYELMLIKLNYNDIDLLINKTGRTKEALIKKINKMKKKGEIKEYKSLIANKINSIIDTIDESKTTIDNKVKILLEIGRNLKGVDCIGYND